MVRHQSIKLTYSKKRKTVPVASVSGQTRHRKECRWSKVRKIFVYCLGKLHNCFATANGPKARWGDNQTSSLLQSVTRNTPKNATTIDYFLTGDGIKSREWTRGKPEWAISGHNPPRSISKGCNLNPLLLSLNTGQRF